MMAFSGMNLLARSQNVISAPSLLERGLWEKSTALQMTISGWSLAAPSLLCSCFQYILRPQFALEIALPIEEASCALDPRCTCGNTVNTLLQLILIYCIKQTFSISIAHDALAREKHSWMIASFLSAIPTSLCEKPLKCSCQDPCFMRNHYPRRTVLGIIGRDGAMSRRLSLPAANLHQVPDSVTNREAVFAEPLAAALRIVEQQVCNAADHEAWFLLQNLDSACLACALEWTNHRAGALVGQI